MPRIHPKPEFFEALAGRLLPEDRRLLRHVLGCEVCREALTNALEPVQARATARILPWRTAEPDYGRTIDGVLDSFRPRLCEAARELAAAPGLLAELLRHPAERREVLLRNSSRFRSFALCELLLRTSREETFRDAEAGEGLARLALLAADLLEEPRFGARLLEDLRARSWALIGNARRVVSDLRGSEEAFTRAERYLRAGTGDRVDQARLLAYKASLRRHQRRYGEAASLLQRAISMFLESGESHLAGEALVARAIVCKEVGELEEAITLLRRADELIDAEADPRLVTTARHNLIELLIEKGCLLEAQALLARSRPLYARHAPARLKPRLLWVEGRIARDLGRLEEAAELLVQAHQGLIENGVGYDAALAALELAGVWARLGRTAEVKRLAEGMYPIFRSREVHREAMAALIVFQQAAAAESATLGLVEEIAAYLRRAANDPTLAFERKS